MINQARTLPSFLNSFSKLALVNLVNSNSHEDFNLCNSLLVTINIIFIIHALTELVQGEKEQSDWFPERLNFAIRTAKMDRSQTAFTDLCS